MFSIRLEGGICSSSELEVVCEPQEYECIDELWMHLCSALSSIEGIKFVIEGFDLDWPVDVETDLSTVIPQAFDGYKSLTSDKNFSIELYEQGIEKELHFSIDCDDVQVTCREMVGGKNLNTSEIVEKEQLLRMLRDFNNQILKAGKLLIRDFDSLLESLN